GGIGATSQLLVQGVPLLQLPIHGEQIMNAERTEALGAGIKADINCLDSIANALTRIIADQSFAIAAQKFADKYAGFDRHVQLNMLVERLGLLERCPNDSSTRQGTGDAGEAPARQSA
ncbi:MAG: glycosyltransferase, partial [Pirellulaceae bacterium]